MRRKTCRALTGEVCVTCAVWDPAVGSQGSRKQCAAAAPGGVGSLRGDAALHSHEQQPHLKTNVNNTCGRACYKQYFLMACLGQTAQIDPLPLSSLLPPEEELGKYYRYQGSLTTPDCHEGVIWTVFEKPIELSFSQVSRRGTACKACYGSFAPSAASPLTQFNTDLLAAPLLCSYDTHACLALV